jgi:hypothetical protein
LRPCSRWCLPWWIGFVTDVVGAQMFYS